MCVANRNYPKLAHCTIYCHATPLGEFGPLLGRQVIHLVSTLPRGRHAEHLPLPFRVLLLTILERGEKHELRGQVLSVGGVVGGVVAPHNVSRCRGWGVRGTAHLWEWWGTEGGDAESGYKRQEGNGEVGGR